MTTQQINKAIDQEIWKMRDNEEATPKQYLTMFEKHEQ